MFANAFFNLSPFSFGSVLMLCSDLAAFGYFLLKPPHLLGVWMVIFSHLPPVALPHQCQYVPSHLTTLLTSLGWSLKWARSGLRPPHRPHPPLPPLPRPPCLKPQPPFWRQSWNFFLMTATSARRAMSFSYSSEGEFHTPFYFRRSNLCLYHRISWSGDTTSIPSSQASSFFSIYLM